MGLACALALFLTVRRFAVWSPSAWRKQAHPASTLVLPPFECSSAPRRHWRPAEEAQELVKHTKSAGELLAAGIDGYDALFIPGGHGIV